MIGLTPRQQECAAFISTYQASKHHAPSVRDIQRGLNLASSGAAHALVRRLRQRGVLENVPGRARSLGPAGAQPSINPDLLVRLNRAAIECGSTPRALLNEAVASYLGIEEGVFG